MSAFYWAIAIFLLVNAFACLYRAYQGPTVVDRLLAVNVIVTKTLVVLVILAMVFGRSLLVDVALVYGLLNFVLTVTASRFLETGRLHGDWS
jgi:multicomponent Na+:H+ antiporter subunit F